MQTLTARFVFFGLFVLVKTSYAIYLEGRLNTIKDWAFLGRFCFLADIGRLKFKLSYPKKDCCLNLLLYYDDDTQWSAVYKNKSKNCFEKEAVLQDTYQIINLTTKSKWSGCVEKKSSSDIYLECEGERSFQSSRERWWYIAMSNCNRSLPSKEMDVKYDLKLTNGYSFWTKHFSADEFGILEVNIFFFFLFMVMFVFSICFAVSMRKRRLFHSTYKLFMLCLALEVFGLLFLCISFFTYASNGIQNKSIEIVGKSLGAIAELLFLLLLLLLAKGFTVTRGRLSYSGTIKLTIFITIYAIIDLVLFLYEYVFFDPGLVLYVYESPAGHGWIILRLIGWLWFTYGVSITIKHYPEKNGFYYCLYMPYTIWFYAVPIMSLIAAYSIPKYMRAKLVNGIERVIDFSAYAVFLTLMRPQAANKNFPYHVRTTQIGVAATGESENTDNFRHNVYDETYNVAGPNVFDLFAANSNDTQKKLATEEGKL